MCIIKTIHRVNNDFENCKKTKINHLLVCFFFFHHFLCNKKHNSFCSPHCSSQEMWFPWPPLIHSHYFIYHFYILISCYPILTDMSLRARSVLLCLSHNASCRSQTQLCLCKAPIDGKSLELSDLSVGSVSNAGLSHCGPLILFTCIDVYCMWSF